jgi:cytochrome b
LLLSSIVIVGTGWASYNSVGGNWVSEWHEGASALMLAVVLVHVAGVAVSSMLHRENLVRAMVTGNKQGSADQGNEQGIKRPWRVLAIVMMLAVLGFWWLQWRGAP